MKMNFVSLMMTRKYGFKMRVTGSISNLIGLSQPWADKQTRHQRALKGEMGRKRAMAIRSIAIKTKEIIQENENLLKMKNADK